MPIPLLVIFKIPALVFAIIGALKVRNIVKRKPDDEKIYCFYRFFFFLSLIFATFFIPVFVKNLKIVQIGFYAANFFIFFGMAYLGKLILIMTYFKQFRKILFWLMITMAFGELFLGLIYFKPALVLGYHVFELSFIGWTINFPSWLSLLHGILTILLLGSASAMFFLKGRQQEYPYLKIRSYLFGSGVFFLAIAAVAYFLFGALVIINLDKDIIHGVASILSPALILAGIFYKKNKNEEELND